MPNRIDIKVRTNETELQFQIDSKVRGSFLFDLVCKTLGIYEVWYFGLFFFDSKGLLTWLLFDKLVLDQGVSKSPVLQLFFGVKYFPDDVAEELIQETTQHYFYLEVSKLILSGDIYCPPEAALLLSSYTVQSKFGDYDSDVYKPGFLRNENLIPNSVIKQFLMSQDMWEDRIVAWYSKRQGLLRDEAELEYLKIAQDLDMYGVSYFEIKNKRGTLLWLGVDSLGLCIYEYLDKMTPKIAFPWSEIRNISFHDKKFVIKPIDKKSPDFVFFAARVRINRQILQLCIGNHELFLRKRDVDSIELQQIKIQAKEDRFNKQADKLRLKSEKEARVLLDLQRSADKHNQIVKKKIETSHIPTHIPEYSGQHLTDKLQKDVIEKGNAKTGVQTFMEPNIIREDDEIAAGTIFISQKVDFLSFESKKSTTDPCQAIEKEQMVETELPKLLIDEMTDNIIEPHFPSHSSFSNEFCTDSQDTIQIAQLKFKIQNDQIEYFAKSSYLYEQMKMLRLQMESLKIREMMSISDIQHEEKFVKGETKYSTINKVKEGTTRNRIAFFEEL